MKFEEAKLKYYESERKKAIALAEFEKASTEVEIAYKEMVNSCDHNMKGIFLKECTKCGYSKTF
jgi:hypothetical protein